MRIVAGRYGGRPLAALGKGDPAAALRPTTDRVRESLFSVLEGGRFGDPLDGARVLDLFAGTGALGLEALSRGAAQATFVENGRRALALLRDNVARLGCGEAARILAVDARRLPAAAAPATLIFLDPPYGRDLGAPALAAARAAGWVAPGALVVWEERGAQAAPEGFSPLEARRYGDSHITLLAAAGT
ncbi:16S rRNA (guanine(966)-N(2))-methyltransferase RsmD [Roseivivax sp. CAU 1761]